MNYKPEEQSYLGVPYHGLRSTNSSAGYGHEPIINISETATITLEDVPQIIDILMPCPVGPYELRVPQQHGAGLCWQDSLFTLLYNADWFKPFLKESIEFYMDQFFKNGETDLIYAKNTEIEQLNFNKATWDPKEGKMVGPMIKVKQRNTAIKIKPIAKAFKDRYGFGLSLGFWEYYCLNLHRYILLGYLFLKHPDILPAAPNKTTKTRLLARRPSIGHANYSKLHTDFKETVFGFMYTGIDCYNFNTVKEWFLKFVPAVSGGTHEFKLFSDTTVADAQIEGYYIGLDHRHVISIFKCGGQWFVYDIDIGCIPFSAEDSAKLDISRIQSFKFENDQKGLFVYTLTLKDGSKPQVSMPLIKNAPLVYEQLAESLSFILVRTAASGGRRTTRKNRSKRKQTRNRRHR